MEEISVINAIRVPEGMEDEAERIRDVYVDYFSRQPGFVRSTFYRALDSDTSFSYINVVVWASQAAFEAVVDAGFAHPEGLNADGMKVLGRGFPDPIEVNPGRYVQIRGEGPPR